MIPQEAALKEAVAAHQDATKRLVVQEAALAAARDETQLRAKAIAFAIRDLRTAYDISTATIARRLMPWGETDQAMVKYIRFEDTGETEVHFALADVLKVIEDLCREKVT